MDYGRSFKYAFDDKDWLKKILIGGVLNIVPIANFIPVGYGLRTMKAVGEGRETPLPEWDDWGGDFIKGLLVFVASLIYAAPIIVLSILGAIVAAVAGDSSDGGVAAVCMSGVTCLSVLWGLAMAVFLPAAMLKYVQAGEFSAFFRFTEIWDFIRSNLGDYIVAVLVSILAAIVAGIVGSIACGIGTLFTAFWATLVAAHLFGQLLAKITPASPFIGGPVAPTFTETPSGQV